MKKKKKSRRSKEKYPALKKQYNLKTRQELIEDFDDYAFALDEEALEWANRFSEEFNNAKLDRKNLENNLHNTKELKRDCDARNNARNRCMLTRAKASGTASSLYKVHWQYEENGDNFEYEDGLIDCIDADLLENDAVNTTNNTDDDGNDRD